MRVLERWSWEDLEWGSALARAHATGALPDAIRPPDFRDLGRAAARPDIDPTFLDALCAEMDREARRAWQPLRGRGARAVVTGQQPGCAGGPLLTFYKVATAVALARRAAAQLGVPVVPVFWNAADDVDFDEIARVAWVDRDRGLLFLELPKAGRRAAGWIGDLAADGDIAACRAALEMLPPERRDAVRDLLPRQAADHGTWVAGLLRRVFPDLAVLDGRSAVLRRHGAPLFERYLERFETARDLVRDRAAVVQASGHLPALGNDTAWLGLFLTPDRVRRKSAADVAPLRQALRDAPESLSPNVLLRALLQDALLPSLAQVVGPSELGYLLELRPLRALLEVHEPALWPRLTATCVDSDVWERAVALRLDARLLCRDPDAALRQAAAARAEGERAQVAKAFEALQRQLASLGGATLESALARVSRRLESVREELLQKVEEASRQQLLEGEPRLALLPPLLRPREQPQERALAGLWLLARRGEASGAELEALASAHLDALERLQPEHVLVGV